ncbi:hypothetical protein BamMEX5DRAFT_1374 [Burkholderia ambifaria MEX-5]|uniref:Uncharacterized protein n=1 Tax=Burkholderia ambifaria MEX-5 TaxID=396597 RepID=B1T0Q8_9BURK|nr:hypothetical protein BamMEX5DRAFT_1374 [Burkholderia ambifaria MEX-5]
METSVLWMKFRQPGLRLMLQLPDLFAHVIKLNLRGLGLGLERFRLLTRRALTRVDLSLLLARDREIGAQLIGLLFGHGNHALEKLLFARRELAIPQELRQLGVIALSGTRSVGGGRQNGDDGPAAGTTPLDGAAASAAPATN